MPDAGELVHDLLLLVLELQVIGEFLPGAAPAVLVMFAEWLHPVRRGPLDFDQRTLEVLLPALVDPHGHDIPRHGIGHEYHFPVNTGHRLSLGTDGLHRHAADYFLFFLSTHGRKNTQKPRAMQMNLFELHCQGMNSIKDDIINPQKLGYWKMQGVL